MKTTIVPAQVTTVEDRIAGNLTLSQLLLLALPIFGCSLLYVALPPFLGAAPYKVILMVLATSLCLIMAIRIRGRLLVGWLVVLARYHARPRQHVFNKNVSANRHIPAEAVQASESSPMSQVAAVPQHVRLNFADLSRLEHRLSGPGVSLRFTKNKRGGLRAVITENQ